MATGDPAIDAAFGGADTGTPDNSVTGDEAIDSAFRQAPKVAAAPDNPYRGLPQDMNPEEGKLDWSTIKHTFGQLAGGLLDAAGRATGDKPGAAEARDRKLGIPGPSNDIDRSVRLVAGLGAPAPVPEGPAAATEASIDASHPLAGAAQAEAARLQAMHDQGAAAGFDLRQGATPTQAATASANHQPLSNALVRQELRLPDNAPLTPQLLTKARQTYASPGYEAVKAIPDPIPLGPDAQATIADVKPMVGGRISLPEGDSITGQQAVDLSKKLRARAAQLDKAQGITASGDIPSDLADAHRDAAEAIENATQQHLQATGRGQLAQGWDDARVYTAKTYSAQDALDGAGNVNVSKLKQQILKGKPLSGNLETLANLGARYPALFKLTPEGAANAPGMLRSTAAGLAPAAGGLLGEVVGSGLGAPGVGSAIGARFGQSVAGKIVPP